MDFKTATEYLLFSKDDYSKIKEGIDWMYDQYVKPTQIEATDLTDAHFIKAESGQIVSPIAAAHCLKDMMRTVLFLRGIHNAIESELSKDLNRPVEILYAGCGPYATLLTPFTTIYTTDQVQFTMLEYNPISMDAMNRLYSDWGISKYLKHTILADATLPEVEIKDTYDIIISETMQAGLKKECQVPLTRNLVRFLNPEGTFIPQNIYIDACLVGPDKNELEVPDRVSLGTIYDLDFKNVPPLNYERRIDIPAHPYEYLNSFTTIRVFEDVIIHPYMSGLTCPLIIDRFETKPKSINFKYVEGENPDFEVNYHLE
ncbi:hypothetical protein [Roseivirga sp. E12]|uniref:hypothetical protein n=1 Tax=Roseivirga sp. E12 TaxID=2819237 RepID=UPI001ABCDCF5|nr:hypothetical protein [Roseivirga sp. E12]MBO3698031.1 hypothetical protein [Roseivirga sp. E12]